MQLRRKARPPALISLVPMVDVMLILLVFFMVTSTYLNLDMIPAVKPGSAGTIDARAEPWRRLMIRIAADGHPHLRGKALTPLELQQVFKNLIAEDPDGQLMLLPSGAASAQSLVHILDGAALAGVSNVRVLRLEALE